MSAQKKSQEAMTFMDFLMLGLAGVCVFAVVKVALWAKDLFFRIVGFIGDTVSFIGQMIVLIGLIVVASFVFAAIMDALAPVVNRWRHRQKIRKSISSCSLPSISSFRGAPNASAIDVWLATVVLQRSFHELFAVYPRSDAFLNQESDYSSFRARELSKALLGTYKLMVEQYLFTPIYQAYRAGDEHVVKWINDAITSTMTRHPLRFVGRVLRVVTFKFGFKSGEGFTRETVEDRETDREFVFNEVLWPNYWASAQLFEAWGVEMDLGVETLAVPQLDEMEQELVPESNPSIPLLPPPLEKAIVEAEVERVEEENEEEELTETIVASLADEAVTSVLAVISLWEHDSDALDRPDVILDETDEILRASVPFHPDTDVIYEQLAINDTRRSRLSTFDMDFETEMNREQSPDAPFEAPWLCDAVSELDGDLNPQQFRRLALRHYLNQIEESTGSSSEVEAAKCINKSEPLLKAVSGNPRTKPSKINHHQQAVEQTSSSLYVPEGL